MNARRSDGAWLRSLADALPPNGADVLVCPPATLIAPLVEVLAGTRIGVGGQDCHGATAGAFTGDLAAEHLAEAGAMAVIVGHSERRAGHGETDAMVCAKVEAAWRAGLMAILCLGEILAEREAGRTLDVIGRQVEGSTPPALGGALVVAYEPVWAIGTGKTASDQDVLEAHSFLRQALAVKLGPQAEGVRLLSGGSVKADNAARLLRLDHVDGALVGGASLTRADFETIIQAARG